MALRAYLDHDLGLGTASLERIAASTCHDTFLILRMDSVFHGFRARSKQKVPLVSLLSNLTVCRQGVRRQPFRLHRM